MSRKQRESIGKTLIQLVAMLPWWVGLSLALISYFWLHSVAVEPIDAAPQLGQVRGSMLPLVYKSFASIGQYLLPFICALGAGISAVKQYKRKQLFITTKMSPSSSALSNISWQEFELLVGEAFRRKGYAVVESGGGGADGGIDLTLRKNNERYLVQCKQWRAFKVGVPIVRELYGVMAATGAAGGFVVTSGDFTQEARDFAAGRNIELINGVKLTAMIKGVQQPTPTLRPAESSVPSCPKCGAPMLKRTAKQGGNAGKTFWGCSGFPDCRNIVPID